MSRQHKIFPPLEDRRTVVKRRIFRLFINLFVLLGAGVLYYVVFSFFFDTPQEYRIRKSTEAMRREYEALSERLEEVEAVLDNVEERDRNVFGILFESEPYDLDEYASSRWNRMERLLSMSNSRLGDHLFEHTALLEEGLDNLSRSFDGIRENASALDGAADAIPAIQPVINNDLTLLTASFGMRIHPFYKSLSQHNGVDFTVPEGSRVFATADGTVTEATRRNSSTGLTVTIDHGNGYQTRYGHLGKTSVRRGQKVSRGDIIALSGNSGLSLAPHLHYEVIYDGQPVDPVNYFFMELSPAGYHRLIRIAQSGMQSFD